MTRIVILGSGFGALAAVRALRRRLPDAEISVVAPGDRLVLYPGLVGVAVGEQHAGTTRVELGEFFDRHRVNYVRASVQGLARSGRTVLTDVGEIENDVLVIATGASKVTTPVGLEHTLSICSSPETAEEIHRRVRHLRRGTIACGFGGNPDEPAGARGGPVLELLLSLDADLRRRGVRDEVDLVFFSPASNPGERLGSAAVRRVMSLMERRGIRAHLGHRLRGFEEGRVLTDGGDVAADLVVYVPGLAGPSWARSSGLPLSPGGFIRADRACRVLGHPGVYVVGDAGAYEGVEDWMPKQGHAAELQGVTAAANIASEASGRTRRRAFRQELVCVLDGLDSAVMVYRSRHASLAIPGRCWRRVKRALEARERRRYGR